MDESVKELVDSIVAISPESNLRFVQSKEEKLELGKKMIDIHVMLIRKNRKALSRYWKMYRELKKK